MTMPPDTTGGTSTGRDIDRATVVESTKPAGSVPTRWQYGPPCGCQTIAVCVHRRDGRLVEDLDMSCPVGAALCGSLGIAERDYAASIHACCAQVVNA